MTKVVTREVVYYCWGEAEETSPPALPVTPLFPLSDP